MTGSLFRREVIDHQRERLWGEVVLTQPLNLKFLSLLVATVLVCLIVYLVFGTYTRKERVSGYLGAAEGLVQVHATRTGTVSELPVQPGEHVSKGDVLVKVRTDKVLADGLTMNSLVVDLLEQQKRRLRHRIERREKREAARRQYLKRKIKNHELKIEQLRRQRDLQKKRLSLADSRYRALEGLHRDALISDEDYESRYQALLDEQQRMEQLAQSLTSEAARLDEACFELDSLENDTQEAVDQLNSEISRIDQQRLQHQGEQAFSIKAPLNGRVTSLQAVVGQMVEPQCPLLAIVPEDTRLQAELFVPTRAIGFIKPELPVRLRYDAFPYERFGIHESRIQRIAKTILAPREVSAPIRPDRPVYRVTAGLNRQTVSAYGREMPLQAGMTLEADILLDERPLYQWILRPLYSLKGTL